jgi:hypothetical protein
MILCVRQFNQEKERSREIYNFDKPGQGRQTMPEAGKPMPAGEPPHSHRPAPAGQNAQNPRPLNVAEVN